MWRPFFISGDIKMHTIKGILIDPEERTVTDVEVEYSLEAWYKLLDCDTVEFAFLSLEEGDVQMICDEEGLYTDKAQFTFSSTNYQQFAGKALIVDFEEELDDNDEPYPIDHLMLRASDIEDDIKWCDSKVCLS